MNWEALGTFFTGAGLVGTLGLALRWYQGRGEQRVKDFDAITKGYQGVFDEIREHSDELKAHADGLANQLQVCRDELARKDAAWLEEKTRRDVAWTDEKAVWTREKELLISEKEQLVARIGALEERVSLQDREIQQIKTDNGH